LWGLQKEGIVKKVKIVITVCMAIGVAFLPAYAAARPSKPQSTIEYRTFDGTDNNVINQDWGSSDIPFLRLAGVGYADGTQAPAGSSRISAREISNLIAIQNQSILNQAQASDFFWQWGQFLDHDMDLTPEQTPAEPFDIEVPTGDLYFDPNGIGNKVIELNRSAYTDDNSGIRQQLNFDTAFIDASNVYGSDVNRANHLRTFKGGKLKTSAGDLLPFNTEGLPNAGGTGADLFLAGDVRANEQIALTCIHTLFMREHNRLCDEIAENNQKLSDEEIYQMARKIVGAFVQHITYDGFLPLLLGQGAIPAYHGYNPQVNPGIATEFATAAYRFGHSMLSPNLLLANGSGKPSLTPFKIFPPRMMQADKAGNLSSLALQSCFFNPALITGEYDIDTFLKGLALQQAQELDNKVVDAVRNFLFGQPGAGGFDLVSLNIQRGRDHGLPDYNSVRKAYQSTPKASFSKVTSNFKIQGQLAEAYKGDVNNMDLWVAGLAEDHVPGAMVGETFRTILIDQFTRLRDGDRFWYQNDPFFTSNPALMKQVENTQLSDIIKRNTSVGWIQGDVLKVP
jgi:peroxidase